MYFLLTSCTLIMFLKVLSHFVMKIKNFIKYLKEEVLKFLNISNWNISSCISSRTSFLSYLWIQLYARSTEWAAENRYKTNTASARVNVARTTEERNVFVGGRRDAAAAAAEACGYSKA